MASGWAAIRKEPVPRNTLVYPVLRDNTDRQFRMPRQPSYLPYLVVEDAPKLIKFLELGLPARAAVHSSAVT
jgi:hypothetical protein